MDIFSINKVVSILEVDLKMYPKMGVLCYQLV